MANTMNTFVMKHIDEVGVMEKPIPDPGPNDAIIKTSAALICTSDVHTVAGAIGKRTNLTLYQGDATRGNNFQYRVSRRWRICGNSKGSLGGRDG
ncbi:hypothetical protein [Candidatus Nitrospira salsa]